MSKKMGINTKAVEARERKQAVKDAKNEEIQKQKEEQFWRDDDKHVNRKLDRQKVKEQKAIEERQRKLANKSAYEEEMAKLAKISAKPTKIAAPKSTSTANKGVKTKPIAVQQPPKLTRFEIQTKVEEQLKQEQAALEKAKTETILDRPLEPNINREDVGETATTIDEALQVLTISDGPSVMDRHPEKRVKNAYLAYENAHLPQLKNENPNMRLSQLKQILKKQWQKAPENPFNQVLRPSTKP